MELNELLEDGWHDAKTDPPDTDRVVQVAWDDGSTGPNSMAFFDGKSVMPDDGSRYWWSHPQITTLTEGSVLAWKERTGAAWVAMMLDEHGLDGYPAVQTRDLKSLYSTAWNDAIREALNLIVPDGNPELAREKIFALYVEV